MNKRDFSSLILFVLGFLLLWEWLRPIEQLTDLSHLGVFIFFILICFLAYYFQLKWIIQFAIKILFILISLNRLYDKNSLYQKNGMIFFWRDIKDLFNRNWDYLSNEFRTLLFFLLLWLMVYLIQYWVLKRKRIFIFFFMTIIYITVLDAFTTYSAKAAIVRTVICGFAIMGMLTYYRIIDKENVAKEPSNTRKWMAPLTILIAFSVLVGLAAPKAAPIWPDPVPYLTSAKDGANGQSSIRKIGYGEDDTHLGGSFIGDKSTVFKVISNGKHYWKVETKDKYTGKGWMASGSTSLQFVFWDLVPVFSIPETVTTKMESAEFFSNIDKNYLIYPAGIQRVAANSYGSEIFKINTNTEKISIFNNQNKPKPLAGYHLSFGVPKYRISDLVKTTQIDPLAMNQKFIDRYTSLPEGLPPRIKQLAEEITAGKTNWFDKAKSIENYFGRPEYTYDQKDVAVPGEKDDYVDQFLFETKRGYCDNFSTSMAVMLRTLGIPTRWVKGFTGGDFMQYSSGDHSKQIYDITNNNAHSWVEVFFPNQGWVPFEPTKGFTSDVEISYAVNDTSRSSIQTTVSPTKPVEKPQKPVAEDKQTTDTKKSFDVKTVWSDMKIFLENKWKWIVLGFVIMGLICAGLYQIRGKWVPYYLLLKYRFNKRDEKIENAYLALLKQLNRYGLKRKENQTLRSYAEYIDSFFSTREMTRLTSYYEQIIYNKDMSKGSWESVRELWENLIKRTIT
jgi:transglutaminase-like putative cysteine protease